MLSPRRPVLVTPGGFLLSRAISARLPVSEERQERQPRYARHLPDPRDGEAQPLRMVPRLDPERLRVRAEYLRDVRRRQQQLVAAPYLFQRQTLASFLFNFSLINGHKNIAERDAIKAAQLYELVKSRINGP